MGWIKYEDDLVWWNSNTGEMVIAYRPPNPRDTPAIWASDAPPSDTPFNEVQDDLFIILKLDWTERKKDPAEVVSTVLTEERVREVVSDMGISV